MDLAPAASAAAAAAVAASQVPDFKPAEHPPTNPLSVSQETGRILVAAAQVPDEKDSATTVLANAEAPVSHMMDGVATQLSDEIVANGISTVTQNVDIEDVAVDATRAKDETQLSADVPPKSYGSVWEWQEGAPRSSTGSQ